MTDICSMRDGEGEIHDADFSDGDSDHQMLLMQDTLRPCPKCKGKVMERNVAERLMAGEADECEVKFLLWLTLCKLQEFTNTVDVDEEEVFDCDAVLDCLDVKLGMCP